jgi:hypothetical protein
MTSHLGHAQTSASRSCGFVPYHDGPRCTQNAVVHVYLEIDGQRVSVGACPTHWPAARYSGWVLGLHRFGPACAHPVTEWNIDECSPAM